MRIHPLRPEDDRAAFDSGDPVLDRFLREFALQNARRHHIGVTYVAEERGVILGYVTVAACSIEREGAPRALETLPAYPLPALRIARLCVDRRAGGRGIGTELTGAALDLGLEMAERVGCVGYLVDAKPQAAGFYARFGFAPIAGVAGLAAARPRQTLMFLSVAAVMKARDDAAG